MSLRVPGELLYDVVDKTRRPRDCRRLRHLGALYTACVNLCLIAGCTAQPRNASSMQRVGCILLTYASNQ